ncbi:Replicative DNA helicase [Piscirickettsia salmonis]|uniref:Replicative DNA helicase n=2 Tax=Piscirickettsia salmonis TaxID=1238 RepID=A0AAC8VIG8_PISSA|nr:DNA helicase, DnaB [Piscirickettsia salmonis]KLV34543.1 DNA helicase [Piscirickettsia salmonis]QGN98230.1 Replicative DNA helicase [Piscirickettsia salmonis]QGO01850.1 Replicative DNA helicase [Piscirickettsia salmonis]QGO12538.1 Replicative DNA helicase [Piscirickettsia salmonis]
MMKAKQKLKKYPSKSQSAALEVADLKVPPHSIEAEQSVLGGLLLDQGAWDKVVSLVAAGDFYRPEHRFIFEEIQSLTDLNQPIDVITVSDALESKGELEKIGGLAYLGELAKNTPSTVNITHYAHIVHERAVLRKLIEVANGIADSAFLPEGRSSDELLDEAESKVFAIAESGAKEQTGPESIRSIFPNVLDRIDELFHSGHAITGVSSGFDDLDKMTLGLQASDLVIVAGRPSMGKTTFAMNIAEYAALHHDKPVLVFSMEMPSESLIFRVLSSQGRIDQSKLRSGQLEDEDWPKLTNAMTMLNERNNLFIDDQGSLSPAELRARARRLAREQGGLSMIIIDYLQLMQVPGEDNRTAEISVISRSLKALAKELNVPVIALSQLNRSLEQRADKRPVMSDLRESGAIEQDADLIMFVYRDEVYNPESQDKGIAEIIIGKQRNGPIGTVRLTFQGRYTRFDNYSPLNEEGFEAY